MQIESFLNRAFESGEDFLSSASYLLKKNHQENLSEEPFEKIFSDDDQVLRAFNLTGVQEALLFSNVSKARRLAYAIIDEDGEINRRVIVGSISYLKKHYCHLGLEKHHETLRTKHFLKVLQTLLEEGEPVRILKGISKPLSNLNAETLIRESLRLKNNELITDVHTKRAVAAAWLTFLRQNVGSCFATAPAIVMHGEQPVRFLTDLRDLINVGRLKRTFGGVEYSFPLSTSWGIGDLRKPIYVDQHATKIATSPGFIEALVAAKIIDFELPYEKKAAVAQHGVREILHAHAPEFKGGYFTVEALLKLVLLKNFELSEEDLQLFEQRPKLMIQEQLLRQYPGVNKSPNSKSEKILYFQDCFKGAISAFKSMTDNALLKAWEFTIASFAEGKADFARWNLYQSLGMQTNEKDGIGECMFRFLNETLSEMKKLIQSLQSQYEYTFLQLKALEARMKNASSESQLVWLRADYDTRYSEFVQTEEKRDELHEKASRFAELYSFLSQTYVDKFPEYFQEVYDADMQVSVKEVYDDSPAGFRLLCKHGRNNPSLWTMIYTAEQYIDCLVEFFTVTENEISVSSQLEGLRDEFSRLITEIVRHLRTKEFLESSFHRIASAHEVEIVFNPLENLDKISKKPWAYTSGGTMGSLVSCVYLREQPPMEVSKWVENETELLAFYFDSLKTLPYNISKPFHEDEEKSMLAFSPTHAFVLKPGLSPFLHGWQEDNYAFSWIRDRLTNPCKLFLSKIRLDQQMIYRLVDEIADLFKGEISHLIKSALGMLLPGLNPKEFKTQALRILKEEPWVVRTKILPYLDIEIDSILYRMLPLFPSNELEQRLFSIYNRLPELGISDESIAKLFARLSSATLSSAAILSASDLRNIMKAGIMLAQNSLFASIDLHKEIGSAMQKLGYSIPSPLIFADTNWVRDYFGFVVSPSTEELELWRFDYSGTTGHPIPEWKKWLNGSQRKPWGLYIRPFEYGQ